MIMNDFDVSFLGSRYGADAFSQSMRRHDAALRERVTKLDAALREIRSCAFSHATRAYYEVQIDRMLWDVTLPALLAPEAEGKEGE